MLRCDDDGQDEGDLLFSRNLVLFGMKRNSNINQNCTDMPLKVLVIDSDESILEVMEMIITGSGYAFLQSGIPATPEEIALLGPDVILIEDQLDGNGKGRKISTAVKKSALTYFIPVILMTTRNTADGIMRESEADALLVKPFDIARLEELLCRFSGNA